MNSNTQVLTPNEPWNEMQLPNSESDDVWKSYWEKKGGFVNV